MVVEPGRREVWVYAASLLGPFGRAVVRDGRRDIVLRPNRWHRLALGVDATIDSGIRSAGTRLPVHVAAVVYRPHWFLPSVFAGDAEPYEADRGCVRARLRPVPPPPA